MKICKVVKDSILLVVLELGDVNENKATADVLFVKLLTSPLHVVLSVDKDNCVA